MYTYDIRIMDKNGTAILVNSVRAKNMSEAYDIAESHRARALGKYAASYEIIVRER